jgi:hypothetical protein
MLTATEIKISLLKQFDIESVSKIKEYLAGTRTIETLKLKQKAYVFAKKYPDYLFCRSCIYVAFKIDNIKIQYGQDEYSFPDIYIKADIYEGGVTSLFSYYHPHVNHDSICLGDNKYIANLAKYDLDALKFALRQLLCNFGDRPFYHLYNFSKNKKLCHQCLTYNSDYRVMSGGFTVCVTCENNVSIMTEKCFKCNLMIRNPKGRILKEGFICDECNSVRRAKKIKKSV